MTTRLKESIENDSSQLGNKKWIFFDVGYTLTNETKCYEDHVKQCVDRLSKKNIVVSETDYYNLMIDASKNGLKPIRSVWEQFSNKERPKWNAKSEVIYEDTYSTLEKLSKRYKLGIIANQIEGLENRLFEHGIYKFFKVIVSSHEAGVKKPNPQIFQKALQEANTTADNCIYIGDRPDNDIVPAKKLGFTTVRIMKGLGQYQPEHPCYSSDYTIKDLHEILCLLNY
ncbi:hypothetical protein AOC36_02190 [Erysipelothrix larvae]|uniref:Haloacid dehalogenase n=1 Tax=Erysipelothrix larvae TaxID=1514105 RepID=A0A120JTG9_9FIRM|nr:HAD family hydrolase [Erysipelothrix larvae]AMC92835.1 hypothetical protein AOC36_02190 [Erysipelothrix larvae]